MAETTRENTVILLSTHIVSAVSNLCSSFAVIRTNSVLLLSKYLAATALSLSLVIVVGLIATVIQLVRGHAPVDFSAYLMVYGVVLVPGIIFITAVVIAFNVLLRNKHLVYVVAIGAGAGLFYLYSVDYNHWHYNPLLYQFGSIRI